MEMDKKEDLPRVIVDFKKILFKTFRGTNFYRLKLECFNFKG